MKPHPRIRKTIKWTGAAVTVLLLVGWMGSMLWGTGCEIVPGKFFFWARGTVRLDLAQPVPGVVQSFEWMHFAPGWKQEWKPECRLGKYPDWHLQLPFWIPVTVSVVSAVFAWRLDTLARRRARLTFHLCPKCSYDRTGLAKDAVCPECGSKGGPA
jgi:hypothetical protein